MKFKLYSKTNNRIFVILISFILYFLFVMIPGYHSSRDHCNFHIVRSLFSTIKKALYSYDLDNNKYPENLDELVTKKYLEKYDYTLSNGEIVEVSYEKEEKGFYLKCRGSDMGNDYIAENDNEVNEASLYFLRRIRERKEKLDVSFYRKNFLVHIKSRFTENRSERIKKELENIVSAINFLFSPGYEIKVYY